MLIVMRGYKFLFLSHVIAFAITNAVVAQHITNNNVFSGKPDVAQAPFTHPLYIIENKGQVTDQYGNPRTDILYKTSSGSMSVFIGKGELHYQFSRQEEDTTCPIAINKKDILRKTNARPKHYEMYRLDMTLEGANPNAEVIPENKQAYYETYYTAAAKGSDAQAYQKITCRDIYPHIDWVVYTKDNKLEYDFIVNPGGDVNNIKIKYSGATDIVKSDGNVKIKTPLGEINEGNLYAYEQATQKQVAAMFKLKNNTITFSLRGHSSPHSAIIIDPTLVWGTYFGGSAGDEGYGIACDSVGNVYSTGLTASTSDIATTGAYQTDLIEGQDIYLAKFSGSGSLFWATYYGGALVNQYVCGLCCDYTGNVYIAGTTNSIANIATTGSYQPVYGGGEEDACLAKFSSSGSLLWATYYGGDSADLGYSVTCDGSGNVYMEGRTISTSGIATAGAHQSTDSGGAADVFLVKFDSLGNRQWGTYFGGSAGAIPGISIAWDKGQNIYITGEAYSDSDIAFGSVWQSIFSGTSDAFLAKFRLDGSLVWSTYYGGESGTGGAPGVAVDDSGDVFLCGTTESSTGIATAGTHQPSYGGDVDAFIVKFDSTCTRLWGTYFGGSGVEEGHGIACDKWGNVFMTGITESTGGISTAGAYQGTLLGTINAYLANFSGSGALLWATYYGSSTDTSGTSGFGVTSDNSGNVYITGITTATSNIATAGAYQGANGGDIDAFVARFGSFTTGVATITTALPNISLYPNPNNGNFTLSGELSGFYNYADVSVIDASGKMVYRGQITINGNKLYKSISIPGLMPGIYTVRISAGAEIKKIKFSVIK